MASSTGCPTRRTRSSKAPHLDITSTLLTRRSPWGIDSPDAGDRQVLTDPWDDEASEFTWISDGSTDYTTTRGNNGIAQTNPSGGTEYLHNHRPNSPDLKFEYDYDPSMSNPSSYADAAITQLFYTANKCHDVFHVLGFDEAAGNFEIDNNGQGGKGQDFVVLNAQDGSGMNNANFATPPDGQTPRMRMYMWDMTTPQRDASFDAGVVIHEYTHGGESTFSPPILVFTTCRGSAKCEQYPPASRAAPPTPTASAPSRPAAWARAGATSWAWPSACRRATHARRTSWPAPG